MAADDLRETVATLVSETLEQRGHEQLDVARDAKTITDATVLPRDGEFRLHLGHRPTDVAVLAAAPGLGDEVEEGRFLKLRGTSEKTFRVPLAVVGARHDPSTAAIRNQARNARERKEVFPFAATFLVAEATTKDVETLYRQGKHLDGLFVTPDEADEAWLQQTLVAEGLDPHLEELRSLGVVSSA